MNQELTSQVAAPSSSGIAVWRGSPPVRARLAFAAVAATLLTVWSILPWEWSLVDDPDYKLQLLLAQNEHGWLGGIVQRIDAGYEYDRAGGQFRPFLWLYSATFYLLGAGPAHTARLLLLLVALGGVALSVRRHLDGRQGTMPAWIVVVWAVAAAASVRGLFDGISFLSIMELPVVAFVVVAAVDRKPSRKVLWLVIASLCKTPVVGGLFALAVVLFRRKRRGLALIAAGSGLVVIVFARDFALGGSYTAGYELTLAHAQGTILGLARQLALPIVVLASALLWTRQWRPRFDADAFVLGSAGVSYVLLLLPWGSSSGYNLAAPAFLLVAACAIAMTVAMREGLGDGAGAPEGRSQASTPRARLLAPLVIAIAASATVTTIGVTAALDRDMTVRGVVDWANTLPAGDVVGTNGIESATRYEQLLVLHNREGTPPRFVYFPPDGSTGCSVDWIVVMHDQGEPPQRKSLESVRSLPFGDIYRVVGPGVQGPSC